MLYVTESCIYTEQVWSSCNTP